MAFAYMLFGNNAPEGMRPMINARIVDYAHKTIGAIEVLESRAPCKENNDEIGLLSLFRAYVYRNLFLAKQLLGEPDADEWLAKTLKERESLKNTFGRGTIDSKLYDNFCMEYYLSLVNLLSFHEQEYDEFEIMMYKQEVRAYLDSVLKNDTSNIFLTQIAHWCK
jgi:hypothetical protein